jgi:hypothetical protein
VGSWFPGQKVRVLLSTRLIAKRVSVALEETPGILLRDPVNVLLEDVQLFKVGEQFCLPSDLYMMCPLQQLFYTGSRPDKEKSLYVGLL